MYTVGSIKNSPEYGTYTCPGCHAEVDQMKKIRADMWRCLTCAALITKPEQYDPLTLNFGSPLAADLIDARLGLRVPIRRDNGDDYIDEPPSTASVAPRQEITMDDLWRMFDEATKRIH